MASVGVENLENEFQDDRDIENSFHNSLYADKNELGEQNYYQDEDQHENQLEDQQKYDKVLQEDQEEEQQEYQEHEQDQENFQEFPQAYSQNENSEHALNNEVDRNHEEIDHSEEYIEIAPQLEYVQNEIQKPDSEDTYSDNIKIDNLNQSLNRLKEKESTFTSDEQKVNRVNSLKTNSFSPKRKLKSSRISLSNLGGFHTLHETEENQVQFTPRTALTINRFGLKPQDLLEFNQDQQQIFLLERNSLETDHFRLSENRKNIEKEQEVFEFSRNPGQLSLQHFQASKEKKLHQLLNWIQNEYNRLAQIENTIDSWENKKQRPSRWGDIRRATSEAKNKVTQKWARKYEQMLKDHEQDIIQRLNDSIMSLENASKRKHDHLSEKIDYLKSKREFIHNLHQEHQQRMNELKDEKERELYEKEVLRALKVHENLKKENDRKMDRQMKRAENAEKTYNNYSKILEQKSMEALSKKIQDDKRYKEYCKYKEQQRKQVLERGQEKDQERNNKKKAAENHRLSLQKEYLKRMDEYEEKQKEFSMQQKEQLQSYKEYKAELDRLRKRSIARAERRDAERKEQIMFKNQQLDERLQQWDEIKRTLVGDVRYNNNKMNLLIGELTKKVETMVSSGNFNLELLRKYIQQLRDEKKSSIQAKSIKRSAKSLKTVPRYMDWENKQQEQKEKEKRIRPSSVIGVRQLSHHKADVNANTPASNTNIVPKRPQSAINSRLKKSQEPDITRSANLSSRAKPTRPTIV